MKFVDRAVGIDLGTTHSEIALLDPSERDVVIWADRYGRKTFPSVVAWDPGAERFLVGRAARARRGQSPAPIESIKRKMGQATMVEVGPHPLSPEEISAKILTELVALMRADLAASAPADTEVRITRAVITVPAYFDAPQVDATRRAGELAGLEVIGILQEPTAAALYHQWRLGRPGEAAPLPDGPRLVYDLGGGTFDVSVLRAVAGEHRVIAIDGDNYLGGDDFDRRFAERLRQRLSERGHALELGDGDEDRLRRVRLVQLAQEAKEQLSSSDVVHLSRPAWLVDQRGEPVDVDLEVSRSEHEAAIADLVEATLARCELALSRAEAAGVGIGEIEAVLLVGGSTRVPLVERRVTEAIASRTKTQRVLKAEVDTSVSLGAALYAATLGGLRFGDGAASLRATSPLSTSGASIRVSLEVEGTPPGAHELAVQCEGESLGQVALGEVSADRPRLRVEARFGEVDRRDLSCVFVSAEGEALSTLSLPVWRAEVGPRPSALSRAAVMAKELSIEVARAGRTERKLLVPRGATLPASVKTDLYTADRSGTVVLRLYSGLLPIQTLALEVPGTVSEGTVVALELRVSESMAIEAKASVAGRELWSKIEPARLPAVPDRDHVEVLLARGESLARTLWGHRRTFFGWSFAPLAAGLREAATTDPDRTRALAAQLEQLLEEEGDAEGLSPPWEHFVQTLDVIRRVAFRTGSLLGEDAASWDARVAALEARGHEAQRAQDAAAWRALTQEAQALEETAASQAHASVDVNDPGYVRIRWASLRRHVERVAQRCVELPLSAAPELRALQEAERARLVEALRVEVQEPLARLTSEAPPGQTRIEIGKLDAKLSRIEAALERLPQLGLVTDVKR